MLHLIVLFTTQGKEEFWSWSWGPVYIIFLMEGLIIYACLISAAFVPAGCCISDEQIIAACWVYIPLRLIFSLAYYAYDLVETSQGVKVGFDLPLIAGFGLDVDTNTAYNVQAILMLAMEILNSIPILAFGSLLK